MKKTPSHLPRRKRDQLRLIAEKIVEKLPDTQMIILYGSYARGDYVEYDYTVEFGIPSVYQSDYDILVVTHGVSAAVADRKLENVDKWYTAQYPEDTPVQFITDDIRKVNKDIAAGRYFYTDIKKEGVLLYDSGNFKLERRRKLRFDEIKTQAEEYFAANYDKANSFYKHTLYAYTDEDYVMASFFLHQSCEYLLKAVRLTYTLYTKKHHDLLKLLSVVYKYAPEGFFKIFPRQTKEEIRLFELLKAAYIEARYNPKFVVTKEDIDVLTPKVEQLLALGKQLCEQRIGAYLTES